MLINARRVASAPVASSLLMTTATAASPTHTPTGADYRPSSSLLSPATDATTDDEDASAPSSSGRPPSASGEDVDSSIGAACAGRYWAAANARRRGGGRRACRAATRVAALSIALFFCRLLGLPAASRGPLQSVRPQRPSECSRLGRLPVGTQRFERSRRWRRCPPRASDATAPAALWLAAKAGLASCNTLASTASQPFHTLCWRHNEENKK